MRPILFAALILVAPSPVTVAGETVVRFRVDPMPEPIPALKHQLLPEVRELIAGNAAQDYLKCFMEQRPFFFSEFGVSQRDRYLAMPLAELAAAKLGGYGGGALRQADRAARMDAVDWQTVAQVQAGGLERPPAELGPLQVLALALNVRLRIEAAERRYDDAIRTSKTMFALGRHLGEYPAGLANELGMWVVHLGLGSVEEMVQQAGCPNLYWALTNLPSPMVDLRRGVQGERTAVAADLRPIRGEAPMTDAEIEACLGQLSGVVGFARERAGRAPRNLRSRLAARANDPEELEAARRRLVEAGSAADVVRKLPPLQAILLDEKLTFEIARDARIRFLGLPLRPIGLPAVGDARPPERAGAFDELLPDIARLRLMQGALEQEIALLRHVEAIRLHAAGNSRHLPRALSEISVPLPDDPFTGKPFDYAVEGPAAHLRGGARPTENAGPASGVRFEVLLRD